MCQRVMVVAKYLVSRGVSISSEKLIRYTMSKLCQVARDRVD